MAEQQKPATDLGAPTWNLISEYPDLKSPEIEADQLKVKKLTEEIEALAEDFKAVLGTPPTEPSQTQALLEKAWTITAKEQEAQILLHDLFSYCYLNLSTDTQNKAALNGVDRLQKMMVKLNQAGQPVELFLMRAPEPIYQEYMAHEVTRDSQFVLNNARHFQKDRFLSLAEENLVSSLGLAGHQSWGQLYDSLTGSLNYELELPSGEKKKTSFSELHSMLGHKNENLRKRAYQGIQFLFHEHDEACAGMLNALAQWRLEMCQRRSHTVPTHFLDKPAHQNRLQRKTIDTMMDVVKAHRHLGQKSSLLQARILNKPCLDPWDVNASAPALNQDDAQLSFEDAIDLIARAYGGVHPDMAEFVQMMAKNQWIDGAPSKNRRSGAFCSGFHKSRTPRVFMTWLGSTVDLIILAHELGHAFHSWVMRDMPLRQTHYPMTLAETASTFGEQAVRNYLIETSESPEAKFDILWQEVSSIPRFTINIPARYEFEKAFYEERPLKSFTPDDFRDLMGQTWKEWYGDVVSGPNDMFWASKMHFYIVEPSFYNFPYTFGYLFSQGIYAEREKRGEDFYPFYVDLLRDTGRMTAEDLVKKHLNMKLDEPEFWVQCFDILEGYLAKFEDVLKELNL